MASQALARFEPTSAIKINDYPKDKYNVLIPGDMTTQVTPFLRPIARRVEIDPDPDHGEVYPITQRKQGERWIASELGLSAVGLAKLASVAGMLDVPQASGRADDGRDPKVVTYRATKAIRLPDGEWRVLTRECTIKLATVEKEIRTLKEAKARQYDWTDLRLEAEIAKELLLKEKFMERLAETGATNRCVRAALALRSKYSPAELAKPFVIAAVVPDVNQPELRERLLDQATSATSALFGPGQVRQEPRQLTSSQPPTEPTEPVEGGELTPEELGAAEPAPVDPQSGEVAVEDPDWAAPAEAAAEPPFGDRFVIGLRERAEASQVTGSATKEQRDQLQATLRGLGIDNIRVVLVSAWNVSDHRLISAAQADAILDAAEGNRDFLNRWRRAAADLASPAT